jgi:hypothetical protein
MKYFSKLALILALILGLSLVNSLGQRKENL